MSIKIAAWNVEGRLSRRTTKRRGSPEHILDGIRRLDADVIVLPEAYYEAIDPGVDEQLLDLGYAWHDAEYGDIPFDDNVYGSRVDRVYLRILSRLPLESVQLHRFEDIRTLLSATVNDPATGRRLHVIAVHLDDRAETLRMKQTGAIAKFLHANAMPAIMLGDFNAVWDGRMARVLRSRFSRRLAGCMPGKWLRSVAVRFADMASGTVLQFLKDNARMNEADRLHQATATPKLHGVEWLPSIRIAQLDHILISDELAVDGVSVMPDGGSDHRAIITTVYVND